MQLPRLADTAERDYFTRRGQIIMQTTGRNPEAAQAQIELPISMATTLNTYNTIMRFQQI